MKAELRRIPSVSGATAHLKKKRETESTYYARCRRAGNGVRSPFVNNFGAAGHYTVMGLGSDLSVYYTPASFTYPSVAGGPVR